MKTKLNISTVVLALSGFIAVQTATAQAPNPHPAQEALKGLQPFIGNWAGEFEAIGGFEGLAKGKMVTGTCRLYSSDADDDSYRFGEEGLSSVHKKKKKETLLNHTST